MSDEARAAGAAAKAVEAVANVAGKALDHASEFVAYFGGVLAELPHDTAGMLGDYVKHVRIRANARHLEKTRRILEERGVKEPREVSPSLLVPLIQAAADEPREELQELWARLLANAMDPKRPAVRQSFTETLRQIEPIDTVVMLRLYGHEVFYFDKHADMRRLAGEVKRSQDEVIVSIEHLSKLGGLGIENEVISPPDMRHKITETAYGRELLQACSA